MPSASQPRSASPTALLALALLGCGAAAQSQPPVTAAAAAPTRPPAQDDDLVGVAVRFGTAALGGDRAIARRLTLTHAELVAMTTRRVTAADYEREVSGFLDGLAREGGEAGPVKVTAKLVKTETLAPGEKRRRFVQIGVVQLIVTDGSGQAHDGPPFLFVHTDAGWRYAVRQ